VFFFFDVVNTNTIVKVKVIVRSARGTTKEGGGKEGDTDAKEQKQKTSTI
jgi:hypothetical protein|tara:strand:+ start:624 stop:773 length:150 start_codon:yes stop_codon:yes gene_type:complete